MQTAEENSSLQVDLITPEKIFFSGQAEMVTAPGMLGEFGVLPGHAPFVSTLRPGVITVDLAGQEKRKIAVLSGIAEVVPDRCLILAETAEDCTAVTAAEAQARLQEAKKAVDDAVTEEEKKSAVHRLAVAEAIAQAL